MSTTQRRVELRRRRYRHFADATPLDVELSCVAINGPLVTLHHWSMLPNHNVLMSVGHLDHVTERYGTLWFIRRTRSKMRRRPNWSIMCLARTAAPHTLGDRQEVWSEDHRAQERSGLLHSWYTNQSLQGKGEQCNSQATHHRPCHGREPCHRLGQGKSGRQRGTGTNQMDKRDTMDQEDTNSPTCMNWGTWSYQLSHTWDQAISR